jgi:hypothetical protein
MFALGTAVFVASLLGSLHCVGMCGPFALLAGSPAGGDRNSSSSRWPAVAGYHLGRLLTYLLIGMLAGSLGMVLDVGGRIAGWQQAATYFAGGLMILTGLVSIGRQFGWLKGSTAVPSGLVRTLQRLLRRGAHLSPLPRAFAVGFLTTWMPCGWLYIFALAAAGTANPIGGLLVMLLFWSGTLPILTLVVWGGSFLTHHRRVNVQPLVAGMVLLIGLGTILFRAPISLENTALAAPSNLTETLQHVQRADEAELPCCSGH